MAPRRPDVVGGVKTCGSGARASADILRRPAAQRPDGARLVSAARNGRSTPHGTQPGGAPHDRNKTVRSWRASANSGTRRGLPHRACDHLHPPHPRNRAKVCRRGVEITDAFDPARPGREVSRPTESCSASACAGRCASFCASCTCARSGTAHSPSDLTAPAPTSSDSRPRARPSFRRPTPPHTGSPSRAT